MYLRLCQLGVIFHHPLYMLGLILNLRFCCNCLNLSEYITNIMLNIIINGAETNCGIARILGILLMNSWDT